MDADGQTLVLDEHAGRRLRETLQRRPGVAELGVRPGSHHPPVRKPALQAVHTGGGGDGAIEDGVDGLQAAPADHRQPAAQSLA